MKNATRILRAAVISIGHSKPPWNAAGNDLIIDGDGTDIDDADMRLREPSPLAKGTRVPTGH